MTGADKKCTKCGGRAILMKAGKGQDSAWKCQECGHTMKNLQIRLGEF